MIIFDRSILWKRLKIGLFHTLFCLLKNLYPGKIFRKHPKFGAHKRKTLVFWSLVFTNCLRSWNNYVFNGFFEQNSRLQGWLFWPFHQIVYLETCFLEASTDNEADLDLQKQSAPKKRAMFQLQSEVCFTCNLRDTKQSDLNFFLELRFMSNP